MKPKKDIIDELNERILAKGACIDKALASKALSTIKLLREQLSERDKEIEQLKSIMTDAYDSLSGEIGFATSAYIEECREHLNYGLSINTGKGDV